MQHEFLVLLAGQRIDPLLVGRGAQRGDGQRLRLAAREQCRAVGARQHADLATDRPHVGQTAPIDAAPPRHDHLAHGTAGQAFQGLGDLRVPIRVGVGQPLGRGPFGSLDGVGAFQFGGHVQGRGHVRGGDLAHAVVQGGVDRLRGDLAFGFPGDPNHLVLYVEYRSRGVLRQEERLQHVFFGHDARAALDHHDGVPAGGHEQVDVAVLELVLERVDDQRAVQPADPNAGDRPAEGDVRDLQRGRCADQSQGVGVVFAVHGQDGRHDLRLAGEPLWKQRANGAVHDARGQDFALRGPAFPLEEAAGNFSGRVRTLLVVDGEREEVHAFADRSRGHGRHQHDGLTVLDERGAAGLLGQASGLDGQRTPVVFHLDFLVHVVFLFRTAAKCPCCCVRPAARRRGRRPSDAGRVS